MEIWLPVSDFSNYEVSSNGRVRNKKRGNILKPEMVKGYYRVVLSDKNKPKPISVHRLVADTFYDGDHEGFQVNNINGNKTDNFIGNLEWVTSSENLLHAYRTGLRTPPCPNPRRVRIIETGEIFNSMAECARHINGSKSHIGECIDGTRSTHKGYHFQEI